MTFYIVHFAHHNLGLWHRHLEAHTKFLEQAVSDGMLRPPLPNLHSYLR